MSGTAKDQNWIELFFEIIEKAYTGSRFTYKNQSYQLKPTLVRPEIFIGELALPTVPSHLL
jgi:ABC-type transporter MlaC component